MDNQLAELYKKIANKINSMIPIDWIELYYLGEVEKGKMSWSSVFYFVESGSTYFIKSHEIPTKYGVSQQIYDELLSELDELLLNLYNCFQQNDQQLWEQVSLMLSSDGKFNIDFLYDIMNEDDGGQLKREIVWAYETFGFIPNDGIYSRKVFDKYIKEKTSQ
ncbi:immunity protein YezG family protein [Paenibacillus durus]|uniref:Cytoplasmic protein n=1 Tax=Paenibacillus durus TaxID=44251 RepID=A0A089HJR5_PAEDU|nr:immunity protein YezG family protein [Paenibacillus durus]AIQ11342.1 hypothetical protein PDUR_04560 [Paenibacillus durus]